MSQMNKSKSQHSNSFNFDNELQLSNTKKDKTGDQFNNKEFFGFQDFPNIGDDRTMRSEKTSYRNQNTSQITRKQNNDSRILDPAFMTQNSIKFKSKIQQKSSMHDVLIEDNRSPKFADSASKGRPQGMEFTLRRTDESILKSILRNQQEFELNFDKPNFKKKTHLKVQPQSQQKKMEEEYKDLLAKINFYEQSIEEMNYESTKIESSTHQLIQRLNNSSYESQVQQYGIEIRKINEKIEDQKNLQAQLQHIIATLKQEHDQIVHSINVMKFKRPIMIKDEVKVLIDEINQLKTEFDAYQRDDGSLNLSSTMHPNTIPNSLQNRNLPTTKRAEPQLQKFNALFSQIHEINKKSEDPRFLYNLKMACLRDDWILYSNSQIQVSTNYKFIPRLRIQIGNKRIQDLNQFQIKQDDKKTFDCDLISGKTYINHQISINSQVMSKLFIKFELTYSIQGIKKQIILFVPTGLTNFGQFTPLTQKQFQSNWSNEGSQAASGYKPIDKSIIQKVGQCCIYMPNLLLSSTESECSGLFISDFNNSCLVQLRQKGQLISVICRSSSVSLMKLLEFIFSV